MTAPYPPGVISCDEPGDCLPVDADEIAIAIAI